MKLAEYFGSVDAVLDADAETIQKVSGIGKVLAEAIVAWGKDKTKRNMLRALQKHITAIAPKKKEKKHPLSGKRIVVTGRVDGYDRDEIKETVTRLRSTDL